MNCNLCQFESGHSLECSKYEEPILKLHDCRVDELDLMRAKAEKKTIIKDYPSNKTKLVSECCKGLVEKREYFTRPLWICQKCKEYCQVIVVHKLVEKKPE
jgi:hypothetical protein